MKQIIQSYKTGELNLAEVPIPAIKSGGILVKNNNSLVSAGTEKLMIDLAKKSILGKARARPDLVKQVMNKVKSDGLIETYKQAMNRLDNPVPLGYSCAGIVEEIGKNAGEFQKGDRVACFGSGYASHAEMVYVPTNLAVKIPDGVDYEKASFVAIGAIALHAVRCADTSLGDNVAVIGLGLLGLITVQLLCASGCNVFGIDTNISRMNLARQFGAKECISPDDNVVERIYKLTGGYGADSVIIFASTQSNQPIEQSADIARERANIVVPGLVGLDIPREIFYKKELRLVVSRSTGPGIYDPEYEDKGHDYPISYVRWTERRNMSQFLEMVADGKVKLDNLISHRFSIGQAMEAYKMIMGNTEPFIGVLLSYNNADNSDNLTNKVFIKNSNITFKTIKEIGVGLIGAGQYAKGTLLGSLKKVDVPFRLLGVVTASGNSGKHTADKFGFEYCTTDYKQLLDDKNIDVVLIATRHGLHASMTIEALKAGKHVFVEKPLAMNPEELSALIHAINENQGKIMVGFNRRFSPFAIRIRELLGTIDEPMVINCRVNAGAVPKDSWVYDPEQGGGRIIGEICHFIDLIQYLADSLPETVYAQCVDYNNEKIINHGDNLCITIKLRNGSVGTIIYTANGDKAYPRERLELFIKGSVAVIDNFRSMSFTKKGKTLQKKNLFGIDRGQNNEMNFLFKAIKNGDDFPVNFDEYVYTTLATFKIEESIKDHKSKIIDINELDLFSNSDEKDQQK